MGTKYGVQAAVLSEAIHVGRLNAAGDAFADKEADTDMVLAAVTQYVQRNFDGGLAVTFPGLGLEMTVKVGPLGATPAPSVVEFGHVIDDTGSTDTYGTEAEARAAAQADGGGVVRIEVTTLVPYTTEAEKESDR